MNDFDLVSVNHGNARPIRAPDDLTVQFDSNSLFRKAKMIEQPI